MQSSETQASVAPKEAPATESPSEETGRKILIWGPSGTGKTYSIGTAIDWAAANGSRVALVMTENSIETLLHVYYKDKPLPSCFQYSVVEWEVNQLYKDLVTIASDISTKDQKQLCQKTGSKKDFSFLRFAKTFENFTGNRGESWGNILDSFTSKDIIVIDSLSGLCAMIETSIKGGTLTMDQGQYGIAQSTLRFFLSLMTQGCAATVIMTGHPKEAEDLVTSNKLISIATIGKAMDNEVTRNFSEVYFTANRNDEYIWITKSSAVLAKTRFFTGQPVIPQNFGKLLSITSKETHV